MLVTQTRECGIEWALDIYFQRASCWAVRADTPIIGDLWSIINVVERS